MIALPGNRLDFIELSAAGAFRTALLDKVNC